MQGGWQQARGMEMVRFGVAVSLAVAAVCASSAWAQNQEQFYTYKDWQVRIETVDTGEDLRTTCSMWTGGDGMPTVKIVTSNGDALPPDFYPGVSAEESAIRGYSTVLQNGDRVSFTFEDGEKIPAQASAGVSDDGFAVAHTEFAEPDKLRALKAMRASSSVDIIGPAGVFYHASLSGFTAAYGKIAEGCGFPTTGVIE
jgi:hypothetical protein